MQEPARSAMAGYAAYINTLQARPTPPRFPPPPALPSPEPVPKLQLQLSLPAVRTNNIMSPPPPSAVDEDVSRQRRSYGTSTEGEAPDDGGQGRGQRQGQGRARFSLLIINPNSTKAMTDALEPVVTSVLPPDVSVTYFTAPASAPPSINDLETSLQSAAACLPLLKPLLSQYDAFMIACFSAHPLIPELRALTPLPVVGIFEAAVAHSLQLLKDARSKFGIVTTGTGWKPLLTAGVGELLGNGNSSSSSDGGRFGGVGTTGVDADQLHRIGHEELEAKMKAATEKLLLGDTAVEVVCLGCAGMVGLDRIVKEAADGLGRKIVVVDGVKAAAGELSGMVRCGYGRE